MTSERVQGWATGLAAAGAESTRKPQRFVRRRRHRLVAPLLGLVLVACGANAVTQAANPTAEQLLLSHVPSAISGTCTPVEPADPSRQAQVGCHPAGAAADVTYILFSSNADMDATFQAHLASFPSATGDDCSSGPAQGSYTIGGASAGSLLCDVADGRAFIEWTDDRFAILTIGFSASTDFSGLFQWWLNDAGPVESGGVSGPTPALTGGRATVPPGTAPGTTGPGDSTGPKVPGTPFSRVTGASIHQVLFATGIDSASGSPMGISDAFRTGTPKILALIGWDIIDVGARLDVKLFEGNRLISQQSVTANNPHAQAPKIDLDGGYAIPLERTGGFSAGEYTVELDYHGLPEQVASFAVNDTGDGAPLPGNLSAGAAGTAADLGPVPYAAPGSVLIVTRSSTLRQFMGPSTDAVLAAAATVGTVHDLTADLGATTGPVSPDVTVPLVRRLLQAGSYKYLLILGNDDAVPMGHINLPDSVNYSDEIAGEGIPGDYVVSDDPYVNLDNDGRMVPDLAVARIPTSDDAQTMLEQLGENQPQPVGAFSMVNEVRRSVADGPLSVINGITPVTLYYSPPTLTDHVSQTNEATARFIYILLHGDGSKTDTWWGEIQKWTALDPGHPASEYTHAENDYSDGLTVSSAGARGAIVNVGACFGAYTLDSPLGNRHKTRDNSIAMKFLASGSRTFIADTYISQSTNSDPGGKLEARTGFEILLWQAVQSGATPIDAFFSAKSQYGSMMTQQYASGDADQALSGDANFLAMHEMAYLGRP